MGVAPDPCHARRVRRFAHPPRTVFEGAARRIGVRGVATGLAVVLGACAEDPQETSSLEARARSQSARQTSQTAAPGDAKPLTASEADAKAADAKAADAKAPEPAPPEPLTDPSGDLGTDAVQSDPDAPAVELRLALDPSFRTRVTTVGMVQLPLVEKPTGFAIEEELTLDGCKGEGAARTCRLHHRFTNFDAEPPAGRFLETDHARVAELSLSHDIGADGRALSKTDVEGAAASELTEALAKSHALHCLRLPSEPVRPGATWTDTCSEWARGAVGTREVTWTLARVDDEPGVGQRAELRYRGALTQPSSGGDRTGTVQGVLYFFVDAGQPHLLREQLSMPLKAGGAVTKTTTNVQFARVAEDAPGGIRRMDGQEFPSAPAPAAKTPDAGTPAPTSPAPG